MSETFDPREKGFNYSYGWGSVPKPPIYHYAMKLCRDLTSEANRLTARAWDLEMVIRNVRLATTGEEKAQAIIDLRNALERLQLPQAAE